MFKLFPSKMHIWIRLLVLTLIFISIIGIYFNNLLTIYLPIFFLGLILIYSLTKILNFNKIKQEYEESIVAFIKNCIEIFAFLLAGLYFVYQFMGNVDITNLDVTISTERIYKTVDTSYLAINVQLTKGEIASIYLHDMKAYLYEKDKLKPIDSVSINHFYRFNCIESSEQYQLTSLKNEKEKYRLAANESTHYSDYLEISSDKIYTVVVAILAERRKVLHKVFPQYKASTVSFPIKKQNSGDT